MRYLLAALILVAGLTGTSWAVFEKQKALEATVSMEEAIKIATQSQPGSKPYEVEMESEKGRVVYRIQLVDAEKKTYKIYVDAQDGKIVKKN
jgi:uncharacterized membrane protein YkoI